MALSLWLCDNINNTIYNIQQAGTLISSFPTTNYDVLATTPSDISVANNGTLWICDSNVDKIYNVQQTGTLISSFPTSNYDIAATIPSGISVVNDGTLWVCDTVTKKIYHIQKTGTLISFFNFIEYDINSTYLESLSIDIDDTLWLCDSNADKIYHVNANHKYLGMFSTSVFDPAALVPTGISSANDGTLWLCDSATDKIYNVQQAGTLLSSFTKGAFDINATSMRSISIASNNTLWICDINTDKIYNVQQAGTLLSSFPTSNYDAAATSPQGISSASDGTLWICDAATDKIYNVQQAGTLLSSFATSVFDAAATIPLGISAKNNTLWICDINTDKIYHLKNAGTLISSFTIGVFDINTILLQDISIANDNTLWICESVGNRIIHVQPQGALLSSFTKGVFDANAINLKGISIAQDNTFWLCDYNSHKIYNLQKTGTLISSFTNGIFDVGATFLAGISVAYPTPDQMTKRSNVDIFRRISIKRRLADTSGNYEETWQDISSHVIKWGNIQWGLDKKKYNFFSQHGVSVTVKNDDKSFNEETHTDSFWNGYLTRYRTLVKIEAGFIDPDDENIEIPYPSPLFYGYFTENIKRGDKNKITFQCKSLYSTLDEIPAENLGSIHGSLTSSEIFGRIRDATDGSGFIIFRKYFSSNAWNIETTVNTLTTLSTSTMLDNLTCWGLAKKLAETENKVVYVDRYKGLNFVSRSAGTNTFSFVGAPNIDTGNKYGHTIKSINNYEQDIDVLYNRVRIKFGEVDTSTSYVTKKESWSVGDLSSTSWIYGVRTLSFENTWLDSTKAEIMASSLLLNLNAIKVKCDITTKFIPHLDLLDKVTIQYNPKEDGMYSFTGTNFKIIGIKHNLDKMESVFTLREI